MKKSHIAIALFCLIFLFFFMLERESPKFQPALDEYGACLDNYIANSPLPRSKTPVSGNQYNQFVRYADVVCQSEMQKLHKVSNYRSRKKIAKLMDEKWDKVESNIQIIWDKCWL